MTFERIGRVSGSRLNEVAHTQMADAEQNEPKDGTWAQLAKRFARHLMRVLGGRQYILAAPRLT